MRIHAHFLSLLVILNLFILLISLEKISQSSNRPTESSLILNCIQDVSSNVLSVRCFAQLVPPVHRRGGRQGRYRGVPDCEDDEVGYDAEVASELERAVSDALAEKAD